MIYKAMRTSLSILVVTFLLISPGYSGDPASDDQWQDPFRSGQEQTNFSHDSLSLAQVLSLVADANQTLEAGLRRIEAANGSLTQAGLWSNPELEIEFEEVGWDAPGFQESEITVLLSQEIELWGNRRNRRQMAQRSLETVQLETQIAAFDIYATTVERYSTLCHAQKRVALARDVVDLAADIVESARVRIDMGAAMQSEMLLGQLEMETAELELAEAKSEMDIAGTQLTSLWQGETSDIVVAQADFDPAVVDNVAALQSLLEGNRKVRSLEAIAALAEAEIDLKRSGAKPNLSLSGGYKRIESNSSNSFVFGVGFPLPFLNRNQGSIRSLESRLDAIRLSRRQALAAAMAEFETSRRRIEQQVSRYRMIKTKVLPTAQETYLSLKSAYSKGKLPYATLIEAQRMMLNLRFELNDIGLTIKLETVALERLFGVTI